MTTLADCGNNDGTDTTTDNTGTDVSGAVTNESNVETVADGIGTDTSETS